MAAPILQGWFRSMRSAHPVTRRDRLLRLSTCRLALRHAGLATPEAVLDAPPELRHRYRHCFGEVLRLAERGGDRQAAILGGDASVERLLVVDRGPIIGARENLLLVTYRIDDDGVGERKALRALVTTLRASE